MSGLSDRQEARAAEVFARALEKTRRAARSEARRVRADTHLALERRRRAARRCHRVARIEAMYLAVTAFGVGQACVARAIAVPKQAVHYACRRTEDLRDDPEFDRRMTRLEEELLRC